MSKTVANKRDTKASDAERRMLPSQWSDFIAMIAQGVKRAEAEKELGVSSQLVQAYMITNAKAKTQYEEAQLEWMRREMDFESIEAIFGMVAGGRTVKDACAEAMIPYDTFYRWVLKDPLLREEYEMARQIQAEGMLDDMIEIADTQASGEVYLDSKGNTRIDYEAIQRSKLKVEQRRWQMAKMNPKRFGEKIHQEVDQRVTVDHSEALERARKRKAELAKRRGEAETEERRVH